MTRINIVPPRELTDQHLIAEYREIFMVAGSLRRTLQSRRGFCPARIPKNYTLNRGHVYFFYNKGKYLHRRYRQLTAEMRARGFAPDAARKFPADIFIANDLYGDWRPGPAAYKIIRRRLRAKINMKPNWYRVTTARK